MLRKMKVLEVFEEPIKVKGKLGILNYTNEK
jgi:hypothetical protein